MKWSGIMPIWRPDRLLVQARQWPIPEKDYNIGPSSSKAGRYYSREIR